MARHTKEWNEGYQAAIEDIKKAMEGGSGDGNGSSGDGSDNLPADMTPPPSGNSNGNQGKSKGNDGSQNQQGNSGNSSGGSRTSADDPNKGIVRPEDCVSNNGGIEDMPGTAGGFFNKEDGDKLAKSEGYDNNGGSSDAVERDWKDAAMNAVRNMPKDPGKAWGDFRSTIEGLYKVQTDWKKALKYVVGKSINDAEKRQAYANKNILISQDRIARTDKDKFDNMDYMIAWIDSSGSMSDDQLKMVLSEVYSLALQKKPVKLIVIQCDTRIQEIKEYSSIKELKADSLHAKVKGRGGTDVKPLWDLMAGAIQKDFKKRHKGNPDLVMIFTDGYVPSQYPRNKRLMNWLCWCILDNPAFNVQYNDSMTKVIHLKTADIR